MNEKKLIENIYRYLDNELSPMERDELERYIAGNPEAEKLFRQCENMTKQFDQLPKVSVDADLKASVLDQINKQQKEKPKNWSMMNVHWEFWHMPAVRYGLIFATGVFLGFMVFTFTKITNFQNMSGNEEMLGTMGKSSSFENMKVADVLNYDHSDVKVLANARYNADVVEIRLELSSNQPVTSIFEFDVNNFNVYSVQPVSVNTQSSTLIASNSVNITNTGSNKYNIVLYNKNSYSNQIYFHLIQNEQQVYNSSITVNR